MGSGVTIWTEGGSNMGMGHVMRSVNIARAFAEVDVPITFLVNKDRTVMEQIEGSGFPYHIASLERTCRYKQIGDVVIMDTKKDVSDRVEELKKRGRVVVMIDNITRAAKISDISILPSLFVENNGRQDGNIYCGGEYIIIGENFRVVRETRAVLEPSSPLKILVTMGGADPNNLTEKVVDALWDMEDIEVTVVIGPAARTSQRIKRMERTDGKPFTFLYGVKDMAPLMAISHVAFTAMGTTLYELVYMWVPSVVIANYRDDHKDMLGIERLGIGFALGYHTDVNQIHIQKTVERLLNNKPLLRRASINCRGLIDGFGATRIVELIRGFIGSKKYFVNYI